MRPKRLYKTKTGRFYYLRKGKRVYIRRKKGAPKLSQKQVVKVVVQNIIADTSRRVRKRRKRQKLKYTKQIVKEQTPAKTGLPVYLFEPKKIIPSLTDRVSTKAKKESTSSYETLLKSIEDIRKMIKIPDTETKTKVPATSVSEQEKKPKRTKGSVKPIINYIKKLYEIEEWKDILVKTRLTDTTLGLVLFNKLRVPVYIGSTQRKNYDALFQKIKGMDAIDLKTFLDKEIFNLKKEDLESIVSITEDGDDEIEGFGSGKGEGGLYNDEIEKINRKVFNSTIPVIAKNELDTLDQYVKPNMDKFGFIINTDPVPQPSESNGHWRAVFINNCDDYQSIEYFDPLVSTPEKSLIVKLKQIAKKMNPEQYFLFKINNLKTQPDESDNCGYHCILFLEKRFHNIPWSEATYYNDYMKKIQPEHSNKGEGEVVKAKRKYKTYL